MTRLDAIADPELRGLLQRARDAMRAGRAGESIQCCCDAFLRLLALQPDILNEVVQPRGVATRTVLLFPRLGANYVESPDGGPKIAFERDKFAVTEAMMYYEFTLDTVVGHNA